MRCVICGKPLGLKEGFVSNVDMLGKALEPGKEPILVCSEECKKLFELSLPLKGRPIVHMSRITGYMQIVENWNKGKQQEFFDRKRYLISEP